MSRHMKILNKIEIAVAFGLIAAITINMLGFAGSCSEIRKNVLRLHILANSDSQEDQNLKLKVRDRLLEEGSYYLEEAVSESEAERILEPQLEKLKETAEDEIRKNGYGYKVRVEICDEYFNTRTYDDVTLPAGKYRALKVIIGEGQGKNWWCVMFPPLCLPAAEESAELDAVLTDDEVEITKSYNKYKIKFKIVEWWEQLWDLDEKADESETSSEAQ